MRGARSSAGAGASSSTSSTVVKIVLVVSAFLATDVQSAGNSYYNNAYAQQPSHYHNGYDQQVGYNGYTAPYSQPNDPYYPNQYGTQYQPVYDPYGSQQPQVVEYDPSTQREVVNHIAQSDERWWANLCSPGGWFLGGREEKEIEQDGVRYIGYFYNLRKDATCHWDCAVKLLDPVTNMLAQSEGFVYNRLIGEAVGMCADDHNRAFGSGVQKIRELGNAGTRIVDWFKGDESRGGGTTTAALTDANVQGCRQQIQLSDQTICGKWLVVYVVLPLILCCCVCCCAIGVSYVIRQNRHVAEDPEPYFEDDQGFGPEGMYNNYGAASMPPGPQKVVITSAPVVVTKNVSPADV